MAVQRFGQPLRVLALPVHAQRHGGQAAVQHPAFVGLQDVAEHAALEQDLAHQLGILGKRHPRHHVAEPGKVLGGGIQHQVGAQQQRMLEDRTEKGVVHHHHGPVRMVPGGVRGAPDVGHHHGRIGGRLQTYDAQIPGRADGLVDGLRVAPRHRYAPHSERLQEVVDQSGGAAIERRRIDDGRARPRHRRRMRS